MFIDRFARTCCAVVVSLAVVATSQADEPKPACCAPAEAVTHDDNQKHEDKDDHAGHDHGGGLFDAIKKAGDLNTLAAALTQAELEELLSHDQWTIFAPTDEAFAKLAPEKLDFLLKLENKAKLKTVLLAHVVKGAIPSNAITTETTKARSEAGSELTIVKGTNGAVTVNGLKVVKADTPAANGIIHSIDTVIVPGGMDE